MSKSELFDQELQQLRSKEAECGKWVVVVDTKHVKQTASEYGVRLKDDDVVEVLNEVEDGGIEDAIHQAIREWIEENRN